MSNPLFRELSLKEVIEGCGLKAGPAPHLSALADRAIGTLTDAELDALRTELEIHTGCWICREGFSDFHLAWTTWTWTPDGFLPDPAGKTAKWPLAPYLPLLYVVELAHHLRKSLPAF